MKAILIDDEPNALDTLEIELNAYCPQVQVMAKCANAKAGIAAIQELNPDLVFLDIEMPWMNGFEMLQQFEAIHFEVIFVTAYDQFAIRAFEFSALDYLLKPVSKAKLISAVDKAANKKEKSLPARQLELLIHHLTNIQNPSPNIALPTPEGLEFVAIADIIYLEADSNYVSIFLVSGGKLFLAKTLKHMEALLAGHHFLRIHQSYLVNVSHIRKYIKGQGGYVIMNNGKSLTVSRANREKLMNLGRK